jgi:hypothetical protein
MMGGKQPKQMDKKPEEKKILENKPTDFRTEALYQLFKTHAIYVSGRWEAALDIAPYEARILVRELRVRYPDATIVDQVTLFAKTSYLITVYSEKIIDEDLTIDTYLKMDDDVKKNT